jgi:hypothetical protein
MRCKPQDLAVVVEGFPVENIGRVIRVTQSFTMLGEVLWRYEGQLEGPNGSQARAVADDCLRPLRDPGDSARDESLEWKPVPVTEREKEKSDA